MFVRPRGEVGSVDTSASVSFSAQKMRGPQRQEQGSKNKDLLSLDHHLKADRRVRVSEPSYVSVSYKFQIFS